MLREKRSGGERLLALLASMTTIGGHVSGIVCNTQLQRGESEAAAVDGALVGQLHAFVTALAAEPMVVSRVLATAKFALERQITSVHALVTFLGVQLSECFVALWWVGAEREE